jgi:GTP pyrophosphokinase
MHRIAEEGIAAHWKYKEGKAPKGEEDANIQWLRQIMEWQQELRDPREFLKMVKVDLYPEEVYAFTPQGQVKSFPRGATPVDFAYSVHTDVGHRCVGARVNGKIVPLHYQLKSGDIVEVLTAKQGRGPSRDWLKLVRTSRARNKIRAWFQREGREDAEHRDQLRRRSKQDSRPKIAGCRCSRRDSEMGFRKADDFYTRSARQRSPRGRHQQMQRLGGRPRRRAAGGSRALSLAYGRRDRFRIRSRAWTKVVRLAGAAARFRGRDRHYVHSAADHVHRETAT